MALGSNEIRTERTDGAETGGSDRMAAGKWFEGLSATTALS